jgi:hypothetical protein
MYRGKSLVVFEEKYPRELVKRFVFGRLFSERLIQLDFAWWKNWQTPWDVDPEPLKQLIADIQTDIVEIAMRHNWERDTFEDGVYIHTIMTERSHADYQRLWELRQSLNVVKKRIYRNKEIYCPQGESMEWSLK